jgi:hypothetical protein
VAASTWLPLRFRGSIKASRGCSSAGRAPALQAGCRRFDPDQLHTNFWKGREVQPEAFFDKCIRRQNLRFLLSQEKFSS